MGLLDGLGSVLGLGMDAMNFGIERENQMYQREMQEKAWEREDTAVQRRVADLQAAGINPLLAAGQAASSMPPIQIGAPQGDLSNAGAMSSMLRNKSDIARTNAEKLLIDQNLQKSKADTATALESARLVKQQADQAQWDLEVSKKRNLRSTDRGLANDILMGIDALKGQFKEGGILGGAIGDTIDRAAYAASGLLVKPQAGKVIMEGAFKGKVPVYNGSGVIVGYRAPRPEEMEQPKVVPNHPR